MTAESIVSKVLSVINLDKTEINFNDDDIKQILTFINDAGIELSRRVRWDKLIKQVITAGNITSYTLPSDYQQLALSGGITLNKSVYVPCRLVTSKALWQSLLLTASDVYYAIINNNTIDFSKQIDADGVKFYYFSNNWVSGNKSAINEAADISLIPKNLLSMGAIWRWKREKGLPYNDELSEYEALILSEVKASRGI